jgi:hypothetical protein
MTEKSKVRYFEIHSVTPREKRKVKQTGKLTVSEM